MNYRIKPQRYLAFLLSLTMVGPAHADTLLTGVPTAWQLQRYMGVGIVIFLLDRRAYKARLAFYREARRAVSYGH
jgi:hypothetical protein